MKFQVKTLKLNYPFIFLLFCLFCILPCFFIFGSSKAAQKQGIKLPIVMYHSVLKSKSGDYIVTPDTLEKDLEYIQSHGYTAITMKDLIEYVYSDGTLPKKPILITFDDGHYNNLGYAIPLLEKYHMKAVISIVGEYTHTYSQTDEANLNYSYLRWKDIQEIMKSGTIEFQNHSYALHSYSAGRKGCMKKYKESLTSYKQVLTNDLQKLQEDFQKNTGYIPTTFTYPFGAVSKESHEIIRSMGFKASLSCTSGINYITKDPECLFLLKRTNRPNNANREAFFKTLFDITEES